MHEKHARALALGIGAAVVAAAFAFALVGGRPTPPVASVGDDAAVATAPRGERLFVELGCAGCHSIRGIGDPSGALDDAVAELDAAELERWIVAAPEVAGELSRKARDAKAEYRALPREDLEALIAWLRGPR